MKVFTAFSGYDSQCMALDRLHSNFNKFNYELIGWSEIDKYAIQAHNIIYPQYKDRNYGDISKINWDKVDDFDLFTYSSPCTDFSAAGLQKGGEKGSGTRSSLLWECERAIDAKRPKYLLMENVAALVSKKFIKLFNKWQFILNGYGYINYAQVLNAKDYGVPQNRERIFMVSIRNDIAQKFYFPKPFILERRLKDILEENVDEKYYLSEKSIKGFMKHNEHHIKKGTGFLFSPKGGENIASCITARIWKQGATDNAIMEPLIAAMIGRNPDNPSDRRKNIHCEQRLEVGDTISNTLTSVQKDNLIIEPSVKSIGNVNPSRKGMNGEVYDANGISPTITTNKGEGIKFINPSEKQANRVLSPESQISQALSAMQGGNTQPKIIQRARGFNHGGEKELCPTIGSNSWQENNILHEGICKYKGRYIENGDGLYLGTSESFFRGGLSGISRTIKADNHDSGVCENCRIRRLTPTECFRLMDISDSDIDKLLSSGISNSQLYKLAGNSIVVSCLFHIFRKLFIETFNDDKQLELF